MTPFPACVSAAGFLQGRLIAVQVYRDARLVSLLLPSLQAPHTHLHVPEALARLLGGHPCLVKLWHALPDHCQVEWSLYRSTGKRDEQLPPGACRAHPWRPGALTNYPGGPHCLFVSSPACASAAGFLQGRLVALQISMEARLVSFAAAIIPGHQHPPAPPHSSCKALWWPTLPHDTFPSLCRRCRIFARSAGRCTGSQRSKTGDYAIPVLPGSPPPSEQPCSSY